MYQRFNPSALNRAGVAAYPGKGRHSNLLYCRRVLGKHVIPGSDGRCGPDEGPQCPDCAGLFAPEQAVVMQHNRVGQPMFPGEHGVLYCGRYLGIWRLPGSVTGVCGPTSGPQCDDCRASAPPTYPAYNPAFTSSVTGIQASLNRKPWPLFLLFNPPAKQRFLGKIRKLELRLPVLRAFGISGPLSFTSLIDRPVMSLVRSIPPPDRQGASLSASVNGPGSLSVSLNYPTQPSLLASVLPLANSQQPPVPANSLTSNFPSDPPFVPPPGLHPGQGQCAQLLYCRDCGPQGLQCLKCVGLTAARQQPPPFVFNSAGHRAWQEGRYFYCGASQDDGTHCLPPAGPCSACKVRLARLNRAGLPIVHQDGYNFAACGRLLEKGRCLNGLQCPDCRGLGLDGFALQTNRAGRRLMPGTGDSSFNFYCGQTWPVPCGPTGQQCLACRHYNADTVTTVNRAGQPVTLGPGPFSHLLYCCACASNGGPQCADCVGLSALRSVPVLRINQANVMCAPHDKTDRLYCARTVAGRPCVPSTGQCPDCAASPLNPAPPALAPLEPVRPQDQDAQARDGQTPDPSAELAKPNPLAQSDVRVAPPLDGSQEVLASQLTALKLKEKECAVCFEGIPYKVALIPCGHTKTCQACLVQLKNCPICNVAFTQILRLY